MKKSLSMLLILFYVVALGNENSKQCVPKLGDDVTKLKENKEIYRMHAVGNFLHKCFDITVHNVKYAVCFRKDELVEYIETLDPNFKTPEDVHEGMTLGEIERRLGKLKIWMDSCKRYYYVKLPSTWCAVFYDHSAKTGEALQPTTHSVVRFFFKYKMATRKSKEEIDKQNREDEEWAIISRNRKKEENSPDTPPKDP